MAMRGRGKQFGAVALAASAAASAFSAPTCARPQRRERRAAWWGSSPDFVRVVRRSK